MIDFLCSFLSIIIELKFPFQNRQRTDRQLRTPTTASLLNSNGSRRPVLSVRRRLSSSSNAVEPIHGALSGTLSPNESNERRTETVLNGTSSKTPFTNTNIDHNKRNDDTTTLATTLTTTSKYQRVRPQRPTTGITTTFVLKQLTVGGNKILKPQISSTGTVTSASDLTLAPSILTTAAINEISLLNQQNKRNNNNNLASYTPSRRLYANRRYTTTTQAQTTQNNARTGKFIMQNIIYRSGVELNG